MSSEAFQLTVAMPEDDEGRLEQSQRIRHLAVNQMTQNGTVIPSSEEDRMFLLKMLDGGDKVSLGKMKIKSQDNRAAADNNLALAMTELLGKVGLGNKETPDISEGDYREIPSVDLAMLPDITPVPGQMDQTTHELTYAELEAVHSRNLKPAD